MPMSTGEKKKHYWRKNCWFNWKLTTESGDSKPEQADKTDLAPLKQIKQGVVPSEIQRKESVESVFKISGEPACVKSPIAGKLTQRGRIQ